MSKMTDSVRATRSDVKTRRVTNFMGGNSYELNAIDTLKMVTASSIFGEPSYYRDGEFDEAKIKDATYSVHELMRELSVLDDSKFSGKTTSEIMEQVIDEALDEDFGAVLDWAVTLRKDYFMRLNPQVIMVRAAQHPGRVAFNEANPNRFRDVEKLVMSRADEPTSQLTYFLYKNKNKNKLPNILKRCWADKLSNLSPYQVAKYKNTGLGMIDVVRISHAHSKTLDELMKTGSVKVKEDELTWENLKSAGKTWKEILGTVKMGHMALLRNLRGIFTELTDADRDLAYKVLDDLKAGVKEGKQFPFRYYNAYKSVEIESKVHFKSLILDALEECIDISLDNMPKLHGKTITLTDNSGSAWGTITTEYGSVRVAEIDNLSAVITAMRSDEGYVGVFGDRLEIVPIKKRDGVLSQMKKLNEIGRNIGGSTENGIWLFWDKAIRMIEHWDNVFIYSDMQAGHGGLYGIDSSQYRNYIVKSGYCGDRYIDVLKMVNTYRSKVFNNVNVFSVQTAGYTNVALPEYAYRTNVMYGWTGKEVVFADSMINFWNQKTASKQPKQ